MAETVITTSQFTDKQQMALDLLSGPSKHILLRGGSRSGKTFILCAAVLIRAIKAPKSSHTILRHRFNHLKASIIHGTMPEVIRILFPGLELRLDRTDWFHELPNGSRIWYGGLDDKARTEKILGQEHSTIYLNECSQISYDARNIAMTRLSQNSGLPLKAYYDANPPSTAHWTYKLWRAKVEPRSGEPLKDPENYATLQMNPVDNAANLPADYIEELKNAPARERLRFFEGEWQSQVDAALWTQDRFSYRPVPKNAEEMEALKSGLRRIVVAVDPSGASGPEDTRSDEIGIVVAGREFDGNLIVLEDATLRAGPLEWAKRAVAMYDKWDADQIVAERNFGGAMVESNIRTVRKAVPLKLITASRGKIQRADPVAALYEAGKVSHLGPMVDLEEQFCYFSMDGYKGDRSPDRADAAIWALTELGLQRSTGLGQSVTKTVRGLW